MRQATQSLDKKRLLERAAVLLEKPTFSKEDSSRAAALIDLAEIMGDATLRNPAVREAENIEFRNFLSKCLSKINPKQAELQAATLDELRAITAGSGPGGGYTVPEGFRPILLETLKAYDRLFDPDVVTVFETATGNRVHAPVIDDTESVAVEIGEGSPTSPETEDPTLSEILLPIAPTFRTPAVRFSIELLEDSAFNPMTFLAAAFGVRFARGIGPVLVAALMAKAKLGATAKGDLIGSPPGDGSSSLGYQDLIALRTSVNPAYRTGPRCGFLMNDNTLAAIDGLLDATGHPIITPQYDADGNRRLLGFKTFIAPSMDDIAPSAKPAAFGNFGFFILRIVEGTRVQGLWERWAENRLVGFMGYLRANGGLACAEGADSPVKYLQNASGS